MRDAGVSLNGSAFLSGPLSFDHASLLVHLFSPHQTNAIGVPNENKPFVIFANPAHQTNAIGIPNENSICVPSGQPCKTVVTATIQRTKYKMSKRAILNNLTIIDI